jgi:hypothetical protein
MIVDPPIQCRPVGTGDLAATPLPLGTWPNFPQAEFTKPDPARYFTSTLTATQEQPKSNPDLLRERRSQIG